MISSQALLTSLSPFSDSISELINLARLEREAMSTLLGNSIVAQDIIESAHVSELQNIQLCIDRWQQDFGSIFELQSLGGRLQNGSRPIKVVSQNDGVWVYKPRSGKTETWLQGLFEKLNITGLHVPQTLDKGEYHWSKWVDDIGSQGDMLDSEVYQLYGLLWVLWATLGGTDLHHHNVILNPYGLWLIDVETVTSPLKDLDSTVGATHIIGPHFPWKRSASALNSYGENNNLPSASPSDHAQDILNGVAYGIDLVQGVDVSEHYDELDQIAVRYVLRSATSYRKHWRDIGSIHAQYAMDSLARRLRLGLMTRGLQPFVDTEVKALLSGYIPTFYYQDGYIVDSQGHRLKFVDGESLGSRIQVRIQELQVDFFERELQNAFRPSGLLRLRWRFSRPFVWFREWTLGNV